MRRLSDSLPALVVLVMWRYGSLQLTLGAVKNANGYKCIDHWIGTEDFSMLRQEIKFTLIDVNDCLDNAHVCKCIEDWTGA